MNNVQLGYYRDKKILQELEEHKVLNTYQVASLLFKGNSSLRKAQQRLQKLTEKKKIRRSRLSLSTPYIYYIENATGRFEHLISLNWIYVWVLKNLSSWEHLWSWDYESNYKILKADAFYGIKNTATGNIKFYFIELDRSNNAWDKTVKYNTLFKTEGYANSYWVKHTKVFPTILCVTESKSRLKLIEKSIEEENEHGLNFKVMLLEDIIEEVMP